MSERTAWGFGLATVTKHGDVLDAWFPQPSLGTPPDDVAAPTAIAELAGKDKVRKVTQAVVLVIADLDSPPADTADPQRLPVVDASAGGPPCPTSSGPTTGRARSTASSRPGRGCAPRGR